MSRKRSLSLTVVATLVTIALFGCGGAGRLAEGGKPFGAGVGSLALRISAGGVESRGTSLTRAVPPEVTLFEIHVTDARGTDLVPAVQVGRPTGNTPVSVTIENVPVGDVVVVVLGLDARGTVLVADKTKVTVVEGRNQVVTLTPSPFSPTPTSSPSPTSSPTAVQRFAIVGNEGDNTITSYAIDATTGLLAEKATIGTGAAPVSVDVNGARNTVFVADQTARTLSAFRIDATTGDLSLFDNNYPVALTGTPNAVVVEGNASAFVYTAVTSPDRVDGVQAAPATGKFVGNLNGTTLPSGPVDIKWLPPNYIIVALHASPEDEVKAFTYDTAGDLTLTDFKTVGTGSITGIAVRPPEPGRNFGVVYAAVEDFSTSGPNPRVEAFKIDPDPTVGSVTSIGSAKAANFSRGIATSTTTDFVYVGSVASRTITILKVNKTDGTLTADSTFTLSGVGDRVQALAIFGRFLYAPLATGANTPPAIETYTIATNGSLKEAGPRVQARTSPRSIVVF